MQRATSRLLLKMAGRLCDSPKAVTPRSRGFAYGLTATIPTRLERNFPPKADAFFLNIDVAHTSALHPI